MISPSRDIFRQFDRLIGNGVTLFVVLAYFEFFKFMAIPSAARNLIQVAACGIMFVLIVLRRIYQPEKLIPMNFAGPVIILILGAIPSYFVAQSYHNQSFMISAYANRVIWFYLLYFFVHVYKVEVKFVIRMLLLIGLFAVLLYYIQYTLYPKIIMDIFIMKARGTIRLFVAGLLCTQMAYFYFLHRFLKKNSLGDLIMALVTLSVFVLQGTRQLLAALVFLTLVSLFFSVQVRGRVIKIALLSLASVAVFFMFREIFIELTRVSSSQMSGLSGGIRLRAARFFLTRFQPDTWSYIFGNGNSGPGSIFNQKMELYAHRYRFFISDIGVIGDYVKYGIIFVVAGLYMIAKSLFFKVSPEYRYLKYYIGMQCFTLLTGYGILGGVDILILLILYIFDVDRAKRNVIQFKSV